MKVKIIIISFLLFTLLAGLKSQDIHENFYKKFSVGLALAYGPENVLSLIPPKLSFYFRYFAGCVVATASKQLL